MKPASQASLAPSRSSALGFVTNRIVQDLGQAIVGGEFSGGDVAFPVEAELCVRYGASRSVVREAVKVLTSKRLLAARRRHGTHVRPRQEWNVLDPDVLTWMLQGPVSVAGLIDFTHMRLAIEPVATGLAAVRASEAQLAAIKAALDEMQAALDADNEPLDADIAFHINILHASGNPFFANLSTMVETALRISIRVTNSVKPLTIDDHARVAEAVLRRDPEAAAAASRALLEDALASLERRGLADTEGL